MRLIWCFLLLISLSGSAQWKNYMLTASGDTLNRVDTADRKQGPWLHHYDNVRGEPGFEEEGYYSNNRKEGRWRMFSLVGDLIGEEFYKWGFKDGICRYYSIHGDLRTEQSWKALNPDKEYDTLVIEDIDKLDSYKTVVVKNEGAAIPHGVWNFYGAEGQLVKSERYTLGKLEKPGAAATATAAAANDKKTLSKPKEVLEFEKKNEGKKKIKVKDGSAG